MEAKVGQKYRRWDIKGPRNNIIVIRSIDPGGKCQALTFGKSRKLIRLSTKDLLSKREDGNPRFELLEEASLETLRYVGCRTCGFNGKIELKAAEDAAFKKAIDLAIAVVVTASMGSHEEPLEEPFASIRLRLRALLEEREENGR